MGDQGFYQSHQHRGGQPFTFSSARPSTCPQTQSEPRVIAPLHSPIKFAVPMQQPMQFQPAELQAGRFLPMTMNGLLPATGLPGLAPQAGPLPYPETYLPTPGVVHQGPTTMAQAEVMFDPRTPPPFADRAQLQTPRRHGVLKVTNVSLICLIHFRLEKHKFLECFQSA
jgi:hypothetical protein